MSAGQDDSAEREHRLHEILHSYLQAVDAGQKPNQQDFVRQHPDLATELEAFFADQEKLDRLAQSLRVEGPSPRRAGGVSPVPDAAAEPPLWPLASKACYL